MSIWRYCAKCQARIKAPTAAEDIQPELYGGNCLECEASQPRYKSDDEWIINLDERLREIEQQISAKGASND